jgi:conjugative transfer signal peptidase TraF
LVQKHAPQEVSRSRILAATAAGALLVAAPLHGKNPWLVWNASPSVPLGLYRIEHGPGRRGDLALIRLAPDIAEFADRRNYLPKSAYLIKFVSAVAGDRVCRLGERIVVRGVLAARARTRDSLGQAMPIWQGCRRLALGEFFLLAHSQQSFDSRYFGVVSARDVVGRAVMLWPPPRRR